MNVSNLANLFHQNSIFYQNKTLGQKLPQPPVNDVIQRLSDNLLTAQKQGQDLKKRFDTLELSADTNRGDDSTFSDMPNEMLEIYLNQYKVEANLSQQNWKSLMAYRDQLSAFDQTIQEYQNMLDGKSELPEMMNMEDVSVLLEKTKATRDQLLQEGAAELNRVGREGPTLNDKAFQMVAEDHSSSRSDFQWSIDTSAEDIFAEIDHALASTQKVASLSREGASRVVTELKRRGQADQPYHQPRFDEQESTVR